MSHFAVLVITDSPDEDALAKALAPFQENNMGDCPAEFMTFTDREDEFATEFAEDGVDWVVDPEGNFYDPWDDRFTRDATADEIAAYEAAEPKCLDAQFPNFDHDYRGRNRVLIVRKVIPAGWALGYVPHNVRYATLEDFVAGYHGHDERDPATGRYGYYENPNAKWDWWQIGGRWSGRFAPPGYDPHTDPANIGEDGKVKWPTEWVNSYNQIQVKDLDMPGRLAEARNKRGEHWDTKKAAYEQAFCAGTWPVGVPARYEDAAAEYKRSLEKLTENNVNGRPLYELIEANPVPRALRELLGDSYFGDAVPAEFETREAYVDAARAIAAYAILVDGKWYQQGEMGWFGMSSNEMTEAEWAKQTDLLFQGLDPEKWISVVDCHI